MANQKDEAASAPKVAVTASPFGVTAGVRDVEIVDFPVEMVYKEFQTGNRHTPWHLAVLKDVKVRSYVKDKPVLLEGVILHKNVKPTVEQVSLESVAHVLDFNFQSPDGLYSFTHTFWEIDINDADYSKKKRWDDETLAKLWGGIFGYNTFDKVFTDANLAKYNDGVMPVNFAQYFGALANIFNTFNNGEPVYVDGNGKPVLYRIKLVLWDNQVRFPRFDNIIEPVTDAGISRLVVKGDDNYFFTKKEPKKGTKQTGVPSAGGTAGAGNANAWPTEL